MQKLLMVMDKVNSIDIGEVHSHLGYEKHEKRLNKLQIWKTDCVVRLCSTYSTDITRSTTRARYHFRSPVPVAVQCELNGAWAMDIILPNVVVVWCTPYSSRHLSLDCYPNEIESVNLVIIINISVLAT